MFLQKYEGLRPTLRLQEHEQRNPRHSQLFAFSTYATPFESSKRVVAAASSSTLDSSSSAAPYKTSPRPRQEEKEEESVGGKRGGAARPENSKHAGLSADDFNLHTAPKTTHMLPADLRPVGADHMAAFTTAAVVPRDRRKSPQQPPPAGRLLKRERNNARTPRTRTPARIVLQTNEQEEGEEKGEPIGPALAQGSSVTLATATVAATSTPVTDTTSTTNATSATNATATSPVPLIEAAPQAEPHSSPPPTAGTS